MATMAMVVSGCLAGLDSGGRNSQGCADDKERGGGGNIMMTIAGMKRGDGYAVYECLLQVVCRSRRHVCRFGMRLPVSSSLIGDAVLLGEIACACQRAAFGRGGAGQCLLRLVAAAGGASVSVADCPGLAAWRSSHCILSESPSLHRKSPVPCCILVPDEI
jgi:hypothetical protein